MLSSTLSTLQEYMVFLGGFPDRETGWREARVTVDETKVNVSTLRRCKVGDGMDLEEESSIKTSNHGISFFIVFN
jgi:hypothetical protein